MADGARFSTVECAVLARLTGGSFGVSIACAIDLLEPPSRSRGD